MIKFLKENSIFFVNSILLVGLFVGVSLFQKNQADARAALSGVTDPVSTADMTGLQPQVEAAPNTNTSNNSTSEPAVTKPAVTTPKPTPVPTTNTNTPRHRNNEEDD